MDCKRIRNEEKSMRSDEEVIRHINEIIDRQIQPSNSGKVSLEKYEDGVATMFMSGACSGCASSEYTLQQGILQNITFQRSMLKVEDPNSTVDPYYIDAWYYNREI